MFVFLMIFVVIFVFLRLIIKTYLSIFMCCSIQSVCSPRVFMNIHIGFKDKVGRIDKFHQVLYGVLGSRRPTTHARQSICVPSTLNPSLAGLAIGLSCVLVLRKEL